MNSFQEKFDKVKNPEKYLSPSQIKEGDKLAKKLSYFKALFLFACETYIGFLLLTNIPYIGLLILFFWIVFKYKNMKREFKYIEKEFSE
jgi:hypothetical protein